MRRGVLLAALAAVLAPVAIADVIVLKDGRSLETQGPYKAKGKTALVKLADGTLVAIPLSEIDLEKTAAASAPKATAPTPGPTATPRSLAEAMKRKAGKKATVVLTDQDVSRGSVSGGGNGKDDGESGVEVGSVTAQKGDKSYTITGSVQNTGKTEVTAVSVVIEGVGADKKVVNTTFGKVAKDALAPGEKSTFLAEFPVDPPITSFNYVPRWIAPRKPAAEAKDEKAEQEKAAAAEAPKPTPTPRVGYTPVPRSDVAPPAPNVPLGAPKEPGQGYVPASPDNQPKPPGGR